MVWEGSGNGMGVGVELDGMDFLYVGVLEELPCWTVSTNVTGC